MRPALPSFAPHATELAKMRAARAAMKPVTFGWPVLKGKSNG